MLVLSTFLQLTIIIAGSTCFEYSEKTEKIVNKRALQKSHEKPRLQKLSEFFLEKDFYSDDPDASLINLLKKIASNYLSDCTTVILYDNYTQSVDHKFLAKFFQNYRYTHIHGKIPENYRAQIGELINQEDRTCINFIIFIKDVMRCQNVMKKRSEKVVVVAKSSQWRVQEYLSSEYSQGIANLLVIVKSDKTVQQKQEAPYILYTHKLFVDALGSSHPVVLASWSGGSFSRNTSLFQTKFNHGFSGHRFIIAVAHQPPFVIKRRLNERDLPEFDGIEIKLVDLLSQMYNFSTDYKESPDIKTLGSGEAVIKAVKKGNVNLGIGGLYITESRYRAGTLQWHSEDCAAFISLASTALPRYRAIMGPFRWTVWLALIMVYLGAIFLFSYSDNLTFNYLIKNPEEIENMFWYVFGTFTNCFTFSDRRAWTKAEKNTTKLLIAIYWLFTIIITACYTGSIIAFITLPVYPEVVDTIDQLLSDGYQIGIMDKGGWPQWFQNITDKVSHKLLEDVDYVPDMGSGLRNVTKAFFWSYALLGSREELQFIVKTNFSVGSKRSLLHISEQCFVPFKVGIILPNNSVYDDILAKGIQMILQSGIMLKVKSDVEWNILRTATGKLLAANSRGGGLKIISSEDRALTLDDTQGMFLLLAMGYIVGASVLISEIFGGCFNFCKRSQNSRGISSNSSIPSNPRFHERQIHRERHRRFSLIHHRPRRSMSLTPAEPSSSKPTFEEQFGEKLLHQEMLPNKRNSGVAQEESESTGIDYNEEISKIFSEVLETGSTEGIREYGSYEVKKCN